MARFAGPSFHDGSGSGAPAGAAARTPAVAVSARATGRMGVLLGRGRAGRPVDVRPEARPHPAHFPPNPCFNFSIAWSTVNVAARWLGGNSLNVSRNGPTAAALARRIPSLLMS